MQDLRDQSAFVMVSHSMVDIARFCTSGIVLEAGEVVFQGDVKEAISYYQTETEKSSNNSNVKANTIEKGESDFLQPFHHRHQKKWPYRLLK